VPEILRWLRHGQPFYQRQAIRMLGEIGPPAKSAVPDLIKTLQSTEKETRECAREALRRIDPAAVPQGSHPCAALVNR